MFDGRIFISAFSGKIVAAIFLAACVMLGFGPEEWINWFLSGFSNYITPGIARGAFLAFALIVAMILVWLWLSPATVKSPISEERSRRSAMISAKGNVTNSRIEGNSYPPEGQLLRVDGTIEGSTIKDNRPIELVNVQPQKQMAIQADQLNAMRDRGVDLLSTQVNAPEDFTKLLESLTKWHMEVAQEMEKLSLPAHEIYLWQTIDPLPDGHTAVIASQRQRLNKLRNIITRFLASNVSR